MFTICEVLYYALGVVTRTVITDIHYSVRDTDLQIITVGIKVYVKKYGMRVEEE